MYVEAEGGRMGSSSSRIRDIPQAQQLMQETGFSASHILLLHERFEELDQENMGQLSHEDFEAIGKLAMNPIGGRIIGAFFSAGQETVDFPTFVRVLAHFRPTGGKPRRRRTKQQPEELPNSRSSKLKFAFQLYDMDMDGKISREELLHVLRAMLGLVTEEQLESIAERAMQELELDHDGAISFEEFEKSLEKVNIEHKMSTRFLK